MSGKRPSSVIRCLSQPARTSCSRSPLRSPVRFLTPSKQSQVPGDLGTQLGTRDNGIQVAESQHALGAPEAGGQRLARGLGDDARPGEVELSARLGDADVGQRREAGNDAAGARIGEDGEERDAGVVHEVDGAGGLGHLHEAEDALLHARPAGGAYGNHGQPLDGGQLGAAPEALTDDTAHAAAHEAEVHHGQHEGNLLDLSPADHDRLGEAGLGLSSAQTLGVCLDVDECERIERRHRGPQLTEGLNVGQLTHAFTRVNARMVAAAGADHEVGAEFRQTGAVAAGAALPLGLGGLTDPAFDLDDHIHTLTPREPFAGYVGYRRNNSVTSWPPNPKLLLAATST